MSLRDNQMDEGDHPVADEEIENVLAWMKGQRSPLHVHLTSEMENGLSL